MQLHFLKKRQFFLAIGDCFLFFCAFFLAIDLKEILPGKAIELSNLWLGISALSAYILFLFCMLVVDAYEIKDDKYQSPIIYKLISAIFLAAMMWITITYILPVLRWGRLIFVTFWSLNLVLLTLWRLIALRYIFPKMPKYRVLLLGEDQLIDDIAHIMGNNFSSIYGPIEKKQYTDLVEREESNDIWQTFLRNNFDIVIFSQKSHIFPQLESELLRLRFSGVAVYDALSFYQDLTGKIPVFHTNNFWLLFFSKKTIAGIERYGRVYRFVEVLLSSLILILTLPLLLLCALAIKLDSEGPVFYYQDRLGKFGTPFRITKFRTMINHADQKDGPRWACTNDPRITRVGRLLRRYRLDELPQLLNVLAGDMALIGPRPMRDFANQMLEKQIPFFQLRLSLKPGLTGWAQVNAGYGETVEGQKEKFEYDLYYLLNHSLRLDLVIFTKTIKTILFGNGT